MKPLWKKEKRSWCVRFKLAFSVRARFIILSYICIVIELISTCVIVRKLSPVYVVITLNDN